MDSEGTFIEESELVLSTLEARVLGCLMEKEATTPDIYPLSLNSLINACNQKNNRNPVMDVGEDEVAAAIELLRDKHLLTLFSGANARAIKYRHKFGEVWPVEPAAQAFLCELMLRGPQTAAGLRGNCERLAPVPDLAGTEELLQDLAERPSGALVRRLDRRPGQKESRWTALIVEGADPHDAMGANAASAASADRGAAIAVEMKLPAAADRRIAVLEAAVIALREELTALKRSLGE
jgi:uncharacterized protein